MSGMTLYGTRGWGSALIEAQLDWYGVDYEFHDTGDLSRSAEARRKLAKVNPLAQIPTLALPDGSIMTESAAITLYLAERSGVDALVPAPGSPERQPFLRWLVYVVANIYPTYTYGDEPSRFVSGAAAQADFKQHVDDYRKRLYALFDEQAIGPWFLGERFSALDIYVFVLTHWEPGRKWFEQNTPKLLAIAAAASRVELLQECWRRNFPAT